MGIYGLLFNKQATRGRMSTKIKECLKEKIEVQEPQEIYVIHIGMAPKRRFFH